MFRFQFSFLIVNPNTELMLRLQKLDHISSSFPPTLPFLLGQMYHSWWSVAHLKLGTTLYGLKMLLCSHQRNQLKFICTMKSLHTFNWKFQNIKTKFNNAVVYIFRNSFNTSNKIYLFIAHTQSYKATSYFAVKFHAQNYTRYFL